MNIIDVQFSAQTVEWIYYISYVVLQMYIVYVSEDLQSSGPVHDTLYLFLLVKCNILLLERALVILTHSIDYCGFIATHN